MEQIKKRILDILESNTNDKSKAVDKIIQALFYKNCKQCETSFLPYNRKQVFCSNTCRYDWHFMNNGFELRKYLKRKH